LTDTHLENAKKWLKDRNIGFDFESGKSKIDRMPKGKVKKLAAASIVTKNYGDVSLCNIVKLNQKIDIFTYSSPCQSFSVAGKLEGLKGTSGLLLECEKFIEINKPKVLILENVKNLVGKQFKGDFDNWCEVLKSLGYKNYWKVLNAKDFEVPQNRERVFLVSILGEHEEFKFPEKESLNLRLKDVLEKNVDEKFYLSQEMVNRFLKSKPISSTDIKIVGTTVGAGEGTNCRHWVHDSSGIVGALSATDYKQPKQIVEPFIAASRGRNPENPSDRTVEEPTEQRLEPNIRGISNALATVQEDNYAVEPVLVKEATKKGYKEAYPGDAINLEQPNSETRRGRVGDQIANTLTTGCNQGVLENSYRIRKLTPKECWRLMGTSDDDFLKAQEHSSNAALYKQAGNSIVVDVLVRLFEQIDKTGVFN
ncbi:MAG: DNA (cytosine-5-)-methyltransferase, partial [Fusobacteriaceae bacterium]